jgi:hypothetical protein
MQQSEAKITAYEVTHSKIEYSWDCIALTNALLVRDPKERIGFIDGVREIKKHPWFTRMDWDKLYKKQIEATFKPEVGQSITQRSTLSFFSIFADLRQEKMTIIREYMFLLTSKNQKFKVVMVLFSPVYRLWIEMEGRSRRADRTPRSKTSSESQRSDFDNK